MEISKIYDQLVAHRFDQDPFGIYGQSRDLTLNHIRESLDKDPGKILDIGMGTGTLLSLLHRQFLTSDLLGLEVSEKMIEVAKEKFADQGIDRIKIVAGGAENLKDLFPARSLDLVTMHYILNYVDTPHTMAGIAHLLAPGGYLSVASCTQECFPVMFGMAKNFVSEDYIKEQLSIPLDLNELEREIRAAGLEIVKKEPLRKHLVFDDFDHLKDFVMHSGWLAHPFFGKISEEEEATVRAFTKPLFPLEEWFVSGVILARQPRA